MRLTLIIATALLLISAPARAADRACVTGEYTIVETRASMRIVFVPPSCRNLEAMAALGNKLRNDFAAEQIVFVLIFDDMRAAELWDKMLDAAGSLGAREDRFYDKHRIGSYGKNNHSAFHQYIITLQGLDGPQHEINY